ncbi:MAG: hypothetical protein JXA96_02585 [Sedimentisphaerales bacterium]|nr:hypothetical protein [Sedimentisphaerales bacterium]
MKTSFRTIRISILAILITCSFALAQESSTLIPKPSMTEHPTKRSGESDDAFNNRLRQWENEIRRITAEANIEPTASPARVRRIEDTPNLPPRPEKRQGESDRSYNSRLIQWEEQVRHITAGNPQTLTSTPSIPPRPEKRAGESDASYMNRSRAWEAEVRRLTTDASRVSATPPRMSARPEKRAGESDASYANRLRQWEAEVRRITSAQTAQNTEEELNRLRQEIAKLTDQAVSTSRTGSFTNTSSENITVIPMGEIQTEELLTINEDLNVMSQILINKMKLEKINTSDQPKTQWLFSDGQWIAIDGINNQIPGRNINLLSSMYLQGYGALFQIKVNFPLSALPEAQNQPEEIQNEGIDEVWQQTKQQIYEPKPSTRSTYSTIKRTAEAMYDPQQVENLKASLIQALKYASNIRALQPDESVILRIAGSERSIRVLSTKKEEDQTLVIYESDGVQNPIMIDGDVKEYLKTITAPTSLVIRAKKSDIDAFATDELDFDMFREKVQVLSYPLLQTALPSTTTGRIIIPFETNSTRTTGTGTTTSSTSSRRTTSTATDTIQPNYETEY